MSEVIQVSVVHLYCIFLYWLRIRMHLFSLHYLLVHFMNPYTRVCGLLEAFI